MDLLADDTVIAGTYELDTDAGDERPESMRKRKGSLCIVKNKQLVLEKECPDGGVFDLQIIPHQEEEVTHDAISHHALVAHANGFVVLYKISNGGSDVIAVARHETGATLLTSLNAIPFGSSSYSICVGTSDGRCLVLQLQDMSRFEAYGSIEENSSNQPVWCVRVIPFEEDLLIFTGSDDCTWKIFGFRQNCLQPQPMYIGKDARSGVTSIKLNLQREQESSRLIGSVLVGSYDENLRSYSFSLDADGHVQVVNKCTQHIPGSGVWRIRSAQNSGKSKLLIAGMYSGIHLLDPGLNGLVSKEWPDARAETSEGRQLIYDVVQMRNGSFIVASFYEKCLYILSDK